MDIGNNGVGVGNVVLNFGNDPVGVHNATMNVGDDGVGVRYVVVDVGNDSPGICDVIADVGDDGLGVHNITANIRHDYKRGYRKFGLEADSQQCSHSSDGTYIEDMKDPVEVRPPGSDRLFIFFRVEKSRDRTSLAPLDDVPLDLSHSPAIMMLVNEPPNVCIPDATHVVNSPIASKTD